MESYKEETIKSYNKNARELAEKFKNLMDLNKRKEFQQFLDLLQGKKILDLGCGSGDHSLWFSQKGLDVKAIDISEEMIKLCKEKGVNAEVMDIEDLKFKDESFDGIWAVTSLLHIPKAKIPVVINKLSNILKSKGILHVCVKEGKGEGLIKDKDSDSQRFFSYWEKEELLNLFKERFELIEFIRCKLGHTIFLHFLFRKRS